MALRVGHAWQLHNLMMSGAGVRDYAMARAFPPAIQLLHFVSRQYQHRCGMQVKRFDDGDASALHEPVSEVRESPCLELVSSEVVQLGGSEKRAV